MKKLLLSATACLSMFVTINAQNILPCNTYGVREIYLKTVPGYAAKLNAAEAAANAEYQAFLQNANTAKTTSVVPTYTVPVVFHVLHLGEAPGSGSNIDDQICINALAQVNRDYARQGNDTSSIDPLFDTLYLNSHMKFMMAQKDPKGNCTNGVVHHYDPKTNWDQSDVFNYQYSTYATGNWNPSKYLNIYIVKNIISSPKDTIVGYTNLPGTAPVNAADAIVYNYNYLGQGLAPYTTGILDARSLSHEIGHWFGLSHTFGPTSKGFECGDDDITDTPKTTGFFKTCPKPASYPMAPSVTVPVDSSDILRVKFGVMTNTTSLNSLSGTMIRPLVSLVSTTVNATTDTSNFTAKGIAGGYSDFTNVYGNDFNSGTTNTISITSSAKSTNNNYVGVYMDYNSNGSFADAGEAVYIPTVTVVNYNVIPFTPTGAYTFSTTPVKINKTYTLSTSPGTTFTTTPDSFALAPSKVVIPAGTYGLIRMRVITSNTPITGPTMTPGSGEIEDYNFNIGTTPSPTTGINETMASCDNIRPNVENIMDYSSCRKMFTKGQTAKIRQSAVSNIANRSLLISDANLYFTGILGTKTIGSITTNTATNHVDTTYIYSNPTTVTPCAPISDFVSNKAMTCSSQAVNFVSTSYNSTPTSYSWVFEGGSPSTSTLSAPSVTYSSPGSYSVSLTVSNANGSSTKSVSSYIQTNWNAGQIALPYSENFENGNWWPTGWNITSSFRSSDPNFFTWELSNYGAGTLSNSYKSLVLGNANKVSFFPGFAGKIDIAETPSFDFSNTTNVAFAFDYSFARKTNVVADTFKLQYSTDCGGSWNSLLTDSITRVMAAATGGTVNAPYLPWSSSTTSTTANPKWKTITVANSILDNHRTVKFRFWFKNDVNSGHSQNLYIDNINISGTVGIHEFENSLGLSIYPNPTNSSSTIEFTSPKNSKVNITVYDVTGRVIEESYLNANAGVNSKYLVNSSNSLKAGIYFITLVIDNNKITKKLIIE